MAMLTFGFWWMFVKNIRINRHVADDDGSFIWMTVFLYFILLSYLAFDLFVYSCSYNLGYDFPSVDVVVLSGITKVDEIVDNNTAANIALICLAFFMLFSPHLYNYFLVYLIERHKTDSSEIKKIPYPLTLIKTFFMLCIVMALINSDMYLYNGQAVAIMISMLIYMLLILYWLVYVNRRFNNHVKQQGVTC
jgi:hypothetical protein